MNLIEKDVIVRFINGNINYISDDINDNKLTTFTIKDLKNCDGVFLVKTRKYHMTEVLTDGLPTKVDHQTICKYFVVNNYDVNHVRFFVNEDKSFSLIEVTKKNNKIFMVLTYKGQVIDSAFTRSIRLIKHTKSKNKEE